MKPNRIRKTAIETARWEAEIAYALADVLIRAIEEGPKEAKLALAVVDSLDVRGYTPGLIRRIQEASAFLARKGVAEVVPSRDGQME